MEDIITKVAIVAVVLIVFGLISKLREKKIVDEATVKEYKIIGIDGVNEDDNLIKPLFEKLALDMSGFEEISDEDFKKDNIQEIEEFDAELDCSIKPGVLNGQTVAKVYVTDYSKAAEEPDWETPEIHVGYLSESDSKQALDMVRIYECVMRVSTAGGRLRYYDSNDSCVKIDSTINEPFEAILTIAHAKNAFKG